MAFSQKIKDFIHNAWADNGIGPVATIGPDGPNVSPKGSLIIFDDGHLAYWKRAKRKALNEREQKHEGADVGFGALDKIDRAEDLRGRPLE